MFAKFQVCDHDFTWYVYELSKNKISNPKNCLLLKFMSGKKLSCIRTRPLGENVNKELKCISCFGSPALMCRPLTSAFQFPAVFAGIKLYPI